MTYNSAHLEMETPLCQFTKQPEDNWTLEDAFKGVFIAGGIGSGKTTGSGEVLAKTFLKYGFGGLVLCAKPDEAKRWKDYAIETNRLDDFIFVEKGSGHRFNPFEYEWTRKSEGGGEIFNLSNLFLEVYRMGNRFSGGGGGGEKDRFWETALQRCINRTILLLDLAGEEISVKHMQMVVNSIPSKDELANIDHDDEDEKNEWLNENYCAQCIQWAENNPDASEEKFKLVEQYFYHQMPKLAQETKSIIIESFLGVSEAFSSGILKDYFSQDSTISPELTHEGKIIVLDFPVKNYLKAGVYAQGLFKLIWQQAMERRSKNDDPSKLVPNFLWIDEAQLFLSDYDQIFMTTARSSKTAAVFLTQNISNFYSAIGGSNPRPKVDSLLGNLGTKIFHANNDAVTNEWASRVIGKAFRNITNVSLGKDQRTSLNQQLHWLVEPRDFTTLKSGGHRGNKQVEAIITSAGRTWSNGLNYIKATFLQTYK